MSDDFVRVARVADVPPGSAKAVVVDGREIALFHAEGALYALDNTCPHQGGPLCEGRIEGKTVTCPLHAWTFKLESGKMALGDYALVDTFDVRVEGGDIAIARTPRPRPGAR